jgi:hypothetical protein
MMNQEGLLKKTGNILKELQEQFEYLAQDPQNLNELELELFLANAHFLSDHVHILKKAIVLKPVKELPEHTSVNPSEIQGQQQIHVYEDLFKPDLETPAFEFIVHDQLKERAPELEDEQIIKTQDEQIITEQDEIITVGNVHIIEEDEDQIATDTDEPFIADTDAQLIEETEEQIIAEQDENIIKLSNPISRPITSYDNESEPFEIRSEEEVGEEEIFDESEDRTVIDPEEDEIGPEPFLVPKEPELSTEPVKAVETTAQPITPLAQPEPPKPSSISAYYQPTLNEMLAGKSSVVNNGTPDNPRAPISDLKSAININEKLIFIKDLFDGYNLAYAEAIDLLNKMPDFNTADKFLQSNYAIKHQWSSKQSTADQFYELLHQRFPK